MDTLLMIAVVLTALAVIAQAGVLIAMYLMSRRIAGKAEVLMEESRRLMAPLESITGNLKAVTNDMTETGRIARSQALHGQEIITESHENIRGQMADVRGVVMDTVEEARSIVLRPIRHYSAISIGIAEGVRTFFRRKPTQEPTTVETERE